MTIRKTLQLVALLLIVFPLRHSDIVRRVADDCKCDPKNLGCKILCSGVGSGGGTGGGSSTFDVAPGAKAPTEKPTIVPETNLDTKSLPGLTK